MTHCWQDVKLCANLRQGDILVSVLALHSTNNIQEPFSKKCSLQHVQSQKVYMLLPEQFDGKTKTSSLAQLGRRDCLGINNYNMNLTWYSHQTRQSRCVIDDRNPGYINLVCKRIVNKTD
eukprot:6205944-Amphidinium_carterae.1